MRLIGTIDSVKEGMNFSSFLNRKNISNQTEVVTNKDWGDPGYGTTQCFIWIEDEDLVEESVQWFNLFKNNPNDPQFALQMRQGDLPVVDAIMPSPSTRSAEPLLGLRDKMNRPSPVRRNDPIGPVTWALILGCCLLFLLTQFLNNAKDLPGKSPVAPLFSSPVEKAFLYDYPHVYQLINQVIQLYGYEAFEDSASLPLEGRELVQKINNTPYWQGFYQLFLKRDVKSAFKAFDEVPTFEKIKQGELWRLISPIFLHADIFHIFFNMLWLIVLGKQIERHLGRFRYLLFILLAAVISNTAQYLMGGPNFIGFSGVLCGMLTFIWIRQRKAPWEGYQLDRGTVIFMLVFIFTMAAVQILSFILEKSMNTTISPGIANTAHLMGAFVGLILGRFNFFSRRLV
jgi:GlpG protein